MKNEDMKNVENIQPLSDDELEDVTGGGIKEIVAATTLAAMAMTGQTVSAFGLAKAMAEGSNNVNIEQAPAQDAYGMEYMGEVADYLEVAPEEVSLQLGGGEAATVERVENTDFTSMDAKALSIEYEDAASEIDGEAEAEQAEEVEAVDAMAQTPEGIEEEVVEIELALDEEDATDAEEGAEAEDRAQLMADLIETSVEARQNEGIYAALDNAFSTLAENASVLADPATGVIEADGDQIISMTFDALESRFDYSPEEMMGAIGAAAARADERGELQILGGDPVLVSMVATAANSSGFLFPASDKQYVDAIIDSLGLAFENLSSALPYFKIMLAPLFESGNAEVLRQLQEIKNQVKKAEESIKVYSFDAIQVSEIDQKFINVGSWGNTLNERIDNIMMSETKSEAQKLQEVADLYKTDAFDHLTNAMYAASEAFSSAQDDIIANRNIFSAAYKMACTQVMFSGEAMDIAQIYLVKQLSTYLGGWVALGQIYSAHDQVFGAGELKASEAEMERQIVGRDKDGQHVQSVLEMFKSFLDNDRFIYVNKNGKGVGVRVSGTLGMKHYNYNDNMHDLTETKCGLSDDDLDDIVAYCRDKLHMGLFEYLDKVGFKVDRSRLKITERGSDFILMRKIKKYPLLCGGHPAFGLGMRSYLFVDDSIPNTKKEYKDIVFGYLPELGGIAECDVDLFYFQKP